MSETNYNETVIIPFLQKKAQDLLNANMILEAHLLVEQSKYKNLENKLKDVENAFNLKFSDMEEAKKQLQQTLNHVTQTKNNEIGNQTHMVVQLQNKIEELRKTTEEQANTISINRNSIREQQTIIEDLKVQLNAANIKNRTSIIRKKKLKNVELEDVLDGDSY